MTSEPSVLTRLQAEYQEATERHSVQSFMEGGYDVLSRMFGQKRIDWVWFTDWLTRHGFRNRDGTHLKRETVRRVWARVRADRKSLHKRRERRVDHAATAPQKERRDLFSAKSLSARVAAAAPPAPAGVPAADRPAAPAAAEVAETSAPSDLMAALLADINKASSRG